MGQCFIYRLSLEPTKTLSDTRENMNNSYYFIRVIGNNLNTDMIIILWLYLYLVIVQCNRDVFMNILMK